MTDVSDPSSDLNDCDPGPLMRDKVFYIEMIATFFFVSFILTIKYYNASKEILLNAIAITSVLYGMIHFTAKFSSGCINPAVAIA